MHLFYTPDISGSHYQLDEAESKHAARVLRLQVEDEVVLVDGRGGWHEAVIVDAHPKRCLLEVQNKKVLDPLPYRLHMAVAPTKNMDRLEWYLEKATEIGISEFTPLICQRSERRQVKAERLERIVVSAMKQSLRAWKPVINEAQAYDKFISGEISGGKGIAHCYDSPRKAMDSLAASSEITLLIGPEGDFSEGEVEQAAQAGFKAIHLGDSRLRTETAALYATMAVSLFRR